MFKKICDFKCTRLNVSLEALYDSEQMKVFFRLKDIHYKISPISKVEKAIRWCESQVIYDVVTFKDAEKYVSRYKAII